MLYTINRRRALAMGDAVDLLKAEIHDTQEAERIRRELETLYADRRNIGIERGKRLLTGEQAQAATAYINSDIAELERRQQNDERLPKSSRTCRFGHPRGCRRDRRLLPPGRFRAVVDVLATFTIEPVGKGGLHSRNLQTHRKHIDPRRVQGGMLALAVTGHGDTTSTRLTGVWNAFQGCPIGAAPVAARG